MFFQVPTWIYVVGGIIFLILGIFLASEASEIAKDKGYDGGKWFHMCFWLGLISYIMIAAMPDLALREKQEETNRLLKELAETSNTASGKQVQNRKDDISNYLPEL